MFVKKFEAPSMEKALALVKSELGPDALILSSEKKSRGLLHRPLIEVTAAYDPAAKEKAPPADAAPALADVFPHRRRKEAVSENVAKNETPPRPPSRVDAYEVMAGKRPAPADIDRFHRFESEFLGWGFEADTAVELTRRLLFDYAKADLEIPSFLEKAKFAILRGSVHVLGEEILETRPAWALFGAPGSGKTSLCVKLAVALKRRRRPVGLVSLDRRKILGAGELAAYSKVLGVPFQPLLDRNDGSTLRIVDGANRETIDSSTGILFVAEATARLGELIESLSACPRKPDAIVFTKTDLVRQRGVLFELVRRTRVPVLAASVSGSFKQPLRFFDTRGFVDFVLEGGVK